MKSQEKLIWYNNYTSSSQAPSKDWLTPLDNEIITWLAEDQPHLIPQGILKNIRELRG